VKVKKNGNWTNAAMAAAISAMDGGMGAYLDPPWVIGCMTKQHRESGIELGLCHLRKRGK
jgi:hypothetical protein